MAKPPPSLTRSGGSQPDDNAPDDALVKMRTLRAFIARAISMIPTPAGGITVRRTLFGDVWTAAGGGSAASAWQIDSSGRINPAYVGFVMPTLGGEPLDSTANVLDLTADGDYVYFKLNFTVYWVETYLASWTLDSVSVEQGSSVPTEDADTKYLVLNAISGGAVGPSYFSQSINVRLVDYGPSDTRLEYNP